MVYIASDHKAFSIKSQVVDMCKDLGILQFDLGPEVYDAGDDYPNYAFAVAEQVASEPGAKGILLCGTGGGMTVAANKVKGVRAATANSVEEAKLIRTDDDANILVLSLIDFEYEKYRAIIETWYHTPFSNEERHIRRLKMITDYENGITPGNTDS